MSSSSNVYRNTHINKVGKKIRVMLWICRLIFLATTLPGFSSYLSGRTSWFFSHPFRVGQHNFNRVSGKSVFPNKECFDTHMFQVRIKACPTVTIHSLTIALESVQELPVLVWVRIRHEAVASDSLGPCSRVAI